MARPLLLVDIDGVLNVYGVETCPEGYEEFALFPEDDEPCRLSVRHGVWLRELSAAFDIAWASAWGAQAHQRLGPILGLDEFPFVPMPPEPFPPKDKVPAIDAYVRDRAVAWLDDVLGPEASAWAESRDSPTLLVEVDHKVGLQREEVEALLRWSRRLPATPASVG